MRKAVNKRATHPVEGPGTDVKQQNATQPVEAPGTGTATQPVEALGAGPDVLPTGSAALLAEFSGSDSEEELQSDPGSPFMTSGKVPQTSQRLKQLIRICLKSLHKGRLLEA